MIVWHVTKNESSLKAIRATMEIGLGQNVGDKNFYAHVSNRKFQSGNWALDVIGDDTGEAWILELEIADETELMTDPADDAGEVYGGGWVVSRVPITIVKILSITYVENVFEWEMGELAARAWT